MKKIGLVTCYFHENYGSMLQSYATQKVIDNMGIPNEMIFCNNPHMYMTMSKTSYYFHKFTTKGVLGDKIKRNKGKILYKFLKRDLAHKVNLRTQKFHQFSEQMFRVSDRYANREELGKATNQYSLFIVGSDQLWSPANIDNDFYTLTFVPNTIPKIAYATSFGTTEIPKYQHKKVKQFLEEFDFISVREYSGKKLVETLSSNKATVVCDPTLLLTREDWEKLPATNLKIKNRYIFCYFLGNNQIHREFAKQVKALTGYKIVALQHMDEYVREDEGFADYAPYDVGPGEFVSLIKNAEYVCTDSFHGTVFSIIFGKLFFTFNRFQKGGMMSTNTRIDSLLQTLRLEDRRICKVDAVEQYLDMSIKYEDVYDKLDEFREESMEYLKEAIKNSIQDKYD